MRDPSLGRRADPAGPSTHLMASHYRPVKVFPLPLAFSHLLLSPWFIKMTATIRLAINTLQQVTHLFCTYLY